jgi:hypothetical protein
MVGAGTVPAFLIRNGGPAERFLLPHLLAWSSIGLVAYVASVAGWSTYHYVRDARVTPLAATHLRAEMHALLDEVARKEPRPAGSAPSESATGDTPHRLGRRPVLAFVPNTHVSDIKVNSTLYACRLWSMFACEPVGRVVELLPGEVAEPDTSGSPARGQYAVMQLTDPQALEVDSLRVREPVEGFHFETSRSAAVDETSMNETLL